MLKPPTVLTIARHDPRKGIFDLLQAFSLLNHQGINYSATIIGSGPLLNFHRRHAHQLGLTNINFPGSVPDITPYLKITSVFILPSLEEGSSSLALLEAMAAGLPIIATNIDGIPEDLTHNHSALLVPPGNPAALAAAAKRLLTHPHLAHRLGKIAQTAYFQKHSPTLARHALKLFLSTGKFKVLQLYHLG